MNPEQLKKALDAIEAGDKEAALEILKAMIASAASGGEAPPPEAEAAAETPEEPPPAPEEEQEASIAASREFMRILGAKTPGEASAALQSIVTRVAALDADRAALELSERQGLVAQLVTAGAETPATAWVDADKRTPKKRLMDEPIAELRDRVKVLVKASKSRAPLAPPSEDAEADGERVFKTSKGEIKLSAREIKNCEAQKADVNAYAENKAIRAAARNRT
jgi:hypothetical protein